MATKIERLFFVDPQSPWHRGSNENTNRLLRQYFPLRPAKSREYEGHVPLRVARRAALGRSATCRPRPNGLSCQIMPSFGLFASTFPLTDTPG